MFVCCSLKASQTKDDASFILWRNAQPGDDENEQAHAERYRTTMIRIPRSLIAASCLRLLIGVMAVPNLHPMGGGGNGKQRPHRS